MELDQELIDLDLDNVHNFSLDGTQTLVRVADVIDADTLIVALKHDGVVSKFKVRLRGVDVCELRGHTFEESLMVRDRVVNLLLGSKPDTAWRRRQDIRAALKEKPVLLRAAFAKFDKYGRALANLKLPNGEDLGQWLLGRGDAQAYLKCE